jgi:hypothetical protein
MNRQRLVIVALFFLIGSTALGASYQNPNSSPAGTKVVDAKGTFVGNLLGYQLNNPSLSASGGFTAFSPSWVSREVSNGVWVAFQVTTAGIYQNHSVTFVYSSPNCTGPAYMDASALPLVGVAVGNGPTVGANTAVLFYPAGPAQLGLGGDGSIATFDYDGQHKGCAAVQIPAIPLAPSKSINLNFVPPFTVQ